MKSQSENVVLKEEASVEWFQNESLSVGVRHVIIRLAKIKETILIVMFKNIKNDKIFAHKKVLEKTKNVIQTQAVHITF